MNAIPMKWHRLITCRIQYLDGFNFLHSPSEFRHHQQQHYRKCIKIPLKNCRLYHHTPTLLINSTVSLAFFAPNSSFVVVLTFHSSFNTIITSTTTTTNANPTNKTIKHAAHQHKATNSFSSYLHYAPLNRKEMG